jgi:D-threo-aldose 1-dehydrogenase
MTSKARGMSLGSSLGEPRGDAPRTIGVPGTSIVTSALGFGCAHLYHEPSPSQRRRLLEAAHGAGIRHFDAAPMYGLGLAERELGRFARPRRAEVVIATKFGILPSAIAQGLARVQGPARRLLATFPTLRRQARSSAAGPGSGAAGALLYRAGEFTAAAARASLERSLRELGTDYVDLLLLHDPQPGEVRSDEVCAYLEEARSAGRIRAWGVAGEPDPTLRVTRALPITPPVLQLRDDVLERSVGTIPADASPLRITFGVLAGVGPIVEHVAADSGRRHEWRQAVGCDCADPQAVASLLLRWAARENPDGVVLFSTIRTEHLLTAAAAAGGDRHREDDALDAFGRLLDAQLRVVSPRPRADC